MEVLYLRFCVPREVGYLLRSALGYHVFYSVLHLVPCSSSFTQRCLAPGCYRNPHYGVSRAVDPNSKAQFCTLHKAPGEHDNDSSCCVSMFYDAFKRRGGGTVFFPSLFESIRNRCESQDPTCEVKLGIVGSSMPSSTYHVNNIFLTKQ